jgi:hypothetical protein
MSGMFSVNQADTVVSIDFVRTEKCLFRQDAIPPAAGRVMMGLIRCNLANT